MINAYNIFYPIKIYIGIGETTEQFDETSITATSSDFIQENIRKRDELSGFTAMVNIHNEEEHLDTGVYIHIHKDILEPESIDLYNSTIVHEAYHACNIIYKHIEATPDVDNDEPFAYLLSYVYRCCLDTINQYKKLCNQ